MTGLSLPPDASIEATGGGSGRMFDRIAARYDLLNRVLSFGLDRRWRRRLVRSLSAEPGGSVLDVATGTADVALAIAKTFAGVDVVGLDPSEGMLRVGQAKVARSGLTDRVSLEVGDAQAMPYENDRFSASCIAFGIRNLPDRRQGLGEMVRVTRPGGCVAVLELGVPRRGLLAPLVRFHIRRIVPRLGAWLSGAAEYRYLQRSVAAFPSPESFAALMAQTGVNDVRVHRFLFGAAHLFTGIA